MGWNLIYKTNEDFLCNCAKCRSLKQKPIRCNPSYHTNEQGDCFGHKINILFYFLLNLQISVVYCLLLLLHVQNRLVSFYFWGKLLFHNTECIQTSKGFIMVCSHFLLMFSLWEMSPGVLLGAFNARVGNDSEAWIQNPSGALLLDVCANLSLSITKTMFECKGVHKCTWHHVVQVAVDFDWGNCLVVKGLLRGPP